MGSRYIKQSVIKKLYAKSGNCCALPECHCILVNGESDIGEICHIEGLNPDSARYNPHLTNKEANSIDNLILLCSNHHKLIDQKVSVYTVKCLKKIKAEHEAYIEQITQVDFWKELQRIFQECRFDMIFLEQNFEEIFPEWYFEKCEEGCGRILDLLNEECSLGVSSKDRKKIYGFAKLTDYVLLGVSMNTKTNGNGYAIPIYNERDLDATRKNMKKLAKIYKHYRFNQH